VKTLKCLRSDGMPATFDLPWEISGEIFPVRESTVQLSSSKVSITKHSVRNLANIADIPMIDPQQHVAQASSPQPPSERGRAHNFAAPTSSVSAYLSITHATLAVSSAFVSPPREEPVVLFVTDGLLQHLAIAASCPQRTQSMPSSVQGPVVVVVRYCNNRTISHAMFPD
jgi:hypothetical protein